MKSSSFEIPKPYSFALNSKSNIAALLKSTRTSSKVPIYYININYGLDNSQSHSTEGVVAHTTAWDKLWGSDETMKCGFKI